MKRDKKIKRVFLSVSAVFVWLYRRVIQEGDGKAEISSKLAKSLFILRGNKASVLNPRLFDGVAEHDKLHSHFIKAVDQAEKSGRVLWLLQSPKESAVKDLQKVNDLFSKNGMEELKKTASPGVIVDIDEMHKEIKDSNHKIIIRS